MARLMEEAKAIRLESADPLDRRREWRPWKARGYRVLDPDGVTVWHEREAIRRLVLDAFRAVDADVFLFGSRAGGEASERSDYDVGFWTDSPPPPSHLEALRSVLEELPVPGHVEVVNFRDVPEEFAQKVREGGRYEIWKRRSINSLFTSAH